MEGASVVGAAACRMAGRLRQSKCKYSAYLWTLGVVFLLGGCATPEAVAPSGKWRPLNRYTDVPQAIPLQQAYVFQALPVDGTLKGMLTRWAKDAGVSLVYQHPNDYTLHAQAASIRAGSLTEGASALAAAYALQGVRVDVEGSRLVVTPVIAGPAAVSAENGSGN